MESLHPKPNKGPKACTTCAKAKARCIPGPDVTKCERCHRLNKPCLSQTPAPPRKRKEPKTTRVAELERKLEDLTSRIEKAQMQQQAPSPPESSGSGPSTDVPLCCLRSEAPHTGSRALIHLFPEAAVSPCSGHEHAQRGTAATPASVSDEQGQRTNGWNFTSPLFSPEASLLPNSTTRPVPVSTPEELPPWPTGQDAEVLLAECRRDLAQCFPFVVVPQGMGSNQLRQQRPFLWKAVMMVACHLDGPTQITLGNQLLKDITEAAIIKPQKSIDLLQGLQFLISGFHYNLNSFQMTNLLYLARSICVSLGLGESQGPVKQGSYPSEALERMRGFAGTYYLVTVVFTTNKKPDPLMSTSYLEACCRVLETQMEYPTDELLVWFVRAQQLSQSISLTLSFRANASLQQPADVPMSLIIKSFKQQLQAFKSTLPPQLKSNGSLVGHQYVAEILLYEISLQENCGLPMADRLEFLWACLTACKAFFTSKYAEPVSEEPRFSCMCSFDFIYAFLTALKLVTLVIPGWDVRIVKEELKFEHLVDKQIAEMEYLADRRLTRKVSSSGRPAATSTARDDAAQDPFRKLALKLKMLRDLLCGELDLVFADNVAKAATTGAMTITDATQGIVEDLEGSLWQTLMGAAADWESFDAGLPQGFVF